MQAGTTPIFNFGMTGPSSNWELSPQNSWLVPSPTYHRLLQSAGATEDLFITGGSIRSPLPRPAQDSWATAMMEHAYIMIIFRAMAILRTLALPCTCDGMQLGPTTDFCRALALLVASMYIFNSEYPSGLEKAVHKLVMRFSPPVDSLKSANSESVKSVKP